MTQSAIKPIKRAINGVIFLDKPSGITSHTAVKRIKRIFNAEKAGHTGSLDPLATGMLPICLGEATKYSDYLFNARKVYYVEAQLGIRTTTGDSQGDIIEQTPIPDNALARLESLLPQFTGEIEQIPPMYSAIKVQGQPLYKLARQGKAIPRAPRKITIDKISLEAIKNPTQFALTVTCSKGTYIRTLIEDLGNTLGCGAHVTVLRRTQVGDYNENQLITLETLSEIETQSERDQQLHPMNLLVDHLPKIILTTDQAHRIRQGMYIHLTTPQEQGRTQIITEVGEFLGIGEVQEGNLLAPKRLVRRN